MVKNEEFYSRAQKAKDYYEGKRLYSYSHIVEIIEYEVSNNGDELPKSLIFNEEHYSKYMVKDVLTTLKLTYEEETYAEPYYFIIRNLRLK